MTYVADDGSIGSNPPFFRRIALFFIKIWDFILFFLKTLFGENVNKLGSRYTREYRGGSGGGGDGPGSGPGGPRGPRPSERRIGRINTSGSVNGGGSCCGGGCG